MLRGHVEKRGKSRYYTIVFEHDPKPDPNNPTKTKRNREYIATDITDKRDALKQMDRIRLERAQGTYVAPSKLTVGDFISRWLEAHSINLAPSTYLSYKSCIDNHIIPGLGKILLTNLTASHLESFYADKQKHSGLSSTTVLYMHRIMTKALKYAVKNNLVRRNEAEIAEAPKKREAELHVPTLDEVNAIWQVAKEPYKTIIQTAFLTGMRIGEVLGLKWDDIQDGCIFVNRAVQKLPGEEVSFRDPKRGSRRTVVMSRGLANALAAYKERTKTREYVFEGESGKPVSGSAVYHNFVKYAKAVGLEGIRFHDLRHAHATMLMGHSLDPKVVSNRLGHQSVKITLDTYSHVSPGMQGIVAQTIDRLVGRRFGDDSDANPEQ